MSTVRALLYAPSTAALEIFMRKSGNHPALTLNTTTDLLTFLRTIRDADVVLLHHELAENAATALTRWLSATQPDKRVVIVDTPPDPATIVHYYEVGAAAYLMAGEPAGTLMHVLQLLADGLPRVDGAVGSELLRRVAELQAITQRVQQRSYPLHFEHHRYPVD